MKVTKREVVAIFLIWAILATAIAFQQHQEVQKLEKEMVSLKWQVYSNKTTVENLKSEKVSFEERVKQLESENWSLMQWISELENENKIRCMCTRRTSSTARKSQPTWSGL